MFEPVEVSNWLLLIYEATRHFNEQSAGRMITDFVKGCVAVGKTLQASSTKRNHTKGLIGIKIAPKPAVRRWESGQGNIARVSRLSAFFSKTNSRRSNSVLRVMSAN
jgi:hypothetical protein